MTTRALGLVMLVGGFGLTLLAPAHAAERPQWTAQVDPLTVALGFWHVQVERTLSPAWSLYVGPHVRYFPSLLGTESLPMRGAGVEAGLRHFFGGQAPKGWWAQTRAVLARTWHTSRDGPTGLGGYASVVAGYSAVFADRWVLAGGLGVNYLYYGVAGARIEGVFPAAHSAVGLAF
ncbi:MAG: DUF3575 domain-containing protein [Myxococcales bacterium]|nr:DUF3575 domain-containing protein [Myxococcales bacterium]